jgi:hypothetical protein
VSLGNTWHLSNAMFSHQMTFVLCALSKIAENFTCDTVVLKFSRKTKEFHVLTMQWLLNLADVQRTLVFCHRREVGMKCARSGCITHAYTYLSLLLSFMSVQWTQLALWFGISRATVMSSCFPSACASRLYMILSQLAGQAGFSAGESQGHRWIVSTTVGPPTEGLRQLASLPGWKLLVVGLEETPANWSLPGAVYLSVKEQEDLGFRTLAPSGRDALGCAKLARCSFYALLVAGFLYCVATVSCSLGSYALRYLHPMVELG